MCCDHHSKGTLSSLHNVLPTPTTQCIKNICCHPTNNSINCYNPVYFTDVNRAQGN